MDGAEAVRPRGVRERIWEQVDIGKLLGGAMIAAGMTAVVTMVIDVVAFDRLIVKFAAPFQLWGGVGLYRHSPRARTLVLALGRAFLWVFAIGYPILAALGFQDCHMEFDGEVIQPVPVWMHSLFYVVALAIIYAPVGLLMTRKAQREFGSESGAG